MDHYNSIQFQNFKAFKRFKLDIKQFNILAGPNNAGKSTILAAFRILSAGLRKAGARKAQPIKGPLGTTMGYDVDLTTISIAEENIFHNYNDSEPATVQFTLGGGKTLTLFFPEQGKCSLIAADGDKLVTSPSGFAARFKCSIGFVPILGPVEHQEPLYEREAARLALFNYRAARNFRNIWHHFADDFDSFRELLHQTWPGMDIEKPTVEMIDGKPKLFMFCPEQRIPRELFWSGFGFQVWCQMLAHLIQSRNVSLFLIDEPDIYLHSELQRQLLNILRDLGPDILIATHSTEIITEAETSELVLINKHQNSARRIKNTSQLKHVFSEIGSVLNPTLTQMSKTRRVLFVEGEDFKIIGRIAKSLGRSDIANRRDFAVVPVEGFNPQKIRNLKEGIEAALGTSIVCAAILDRDFRCRDECDQIRTECEKYCNFVLIHDCKEIENYVLVPEAIERAINGRLKSHAKRTNSDLKESPDVTEALESFAESQKAAVLSRHMVERKRFERSVGTNKHENTINEAVLIDFENSWKSVEFRLQVVGGKAALSSLNAILEESCGISISAMNIIDEINVANADRKTLGLVKIIDEFVNFPLSEVST
jgi:energy-coupling factor transporter ATP-binding protein EcfA2